jgi:dolichyldiphosphatase
MAEPSQHYWKPFSLTYVTYPHNTSSVFPPLLALLSLAPPFGTCALAVSSVLHRDVVSAYLLAGAVSAASLTSVLKAIVGQPRPPRYDDDDVVHRRDCGMPSNHSCFAWFVASFVCLYVTRGGASWSAGSLPSRRPPPRASTRDSSPPPPPSPSPSAAPATTAADRLYRHLHSAVAVYSSVAVAAGCAYSRVALGYHTAPQVAAGSALGSSLGAAWYALFETDAVRRRLAGWDGTLTDLEGARVAALLLSPSSDAKGGQRPSGGGGSGGEKRE